MDKSDDDSTDSHVIQMKRCPLCRKTIRCSLRYGNVIRQQLQDIEKVKNEIRTKSSPELPNKALLLVRDRLTTLLTKANADNHQNIRRLMRGVLKAVDGLQARILENKAMLMERYCLMTEKLEKSLKILPEELCAANFFNGESFDTFCFVEGLVSTETVKFTDFTKFIRDHVLNQTLRDSL